LAYASIDREMGKWSDTQVIGIMSVIAAAIITVAILVMHHAFTS
jgi:hypothetical protein